MKIITLVENTTAEETDLELKTAHGLSLYIETDKHKILFDVGPDDALFNNAREMHVDLTQIDTVIISHGHKDHCGVLKEFLEINNSAKVYIQARAFDGHFAKNPDGDVDISLETDLFDHNQLVLLEGGYVIDEELEVFTVSTEDEYYSSANNSLYCVNDGVANKDDFCHEQNLIIKENGNVLIMGCAHKGVINIMQQAAKFEPTVCVGGFHLFNPDTGKTVPKEELDTIAVELDKIDAQFYTCHCTGVEAFEYINERASNIHYLSCGMTLII